VRCGAALPAAALAVLLAGRRAAAVVLAVVERVRAAVRFFDEAPDVPDDFWLFAEPAFFFDTAFLVATFLVDADPFAPALAPVFFLLALFLVAAFLVAAFLVPVFLDLLALVRALVFFAPVFFALVFFVDFDFFRLADFFAELAFFPDVAFFLEVAFLRDVPAAAFFAGLLVELAFFAVRFFDAPADLRWAAAFFVTLFLVAAFFFGMVSASKADLAEAGIIQMPKTSESPKSSESRGLRQAARQAVPAATRWLGVQRRRTYKYRRER
jgi:hypothetical protein